MDTSYRIQYETSSLYCTEVWFGLKCPNAQTLRGFVDVIKYVLGSSRTSACIVLIT